MNTQKTEIPATLGTNAPAEELTYTVIVKDREIEVVLTGQLKHPKVSELRDSLIETCRRVRPKTVSFDFSCVYFVDSQALAALVSIHRICETLACSMIIRNANADIRSLFEITRLIQLFRLE